MRITTSEIKRRELILRDQIKLILTLVAAIWQQFELAAETGKSLFTYEAGTPVYGALLCRIRLPAQLLFRNRNQGKRIKA